MLGCCQLAVMLHSVRPSLAEVCAYGIPTKRAGVESWVLVRSTRPTITVHDHFTDTPKASEAKHAFFSY